MKLYIVSFRGYAKYNLVISNKGITLIEGVSGTGKTTILRAIRWCLYGGSACGEKYHVRIKYKGIHITRKSKPSTVEVTLRGNREVLTGDIAKQHITNRFGPEHLFDLCCYMKQGDIPCPLISSSSKERLKYLSRLAFRDEKDPILLIEAIAEHVKTEKASYSEERGKYKQQKAQLKEYSSEVVIEEEARTVGIKKLAKNLSALTAQLSDLEEKSRDLLVKQTQSKQLHQQLEELQSDLVSQEARLAIATDKYNAVGSETLSLIEAQRKECLSKGSELNIALAKLEGEVKYHGLRVKLARLADLEKMSLPTSFGPMDERGYYALENQHKEFQDNSAVCSKIGIEYNKETISEEISVLKSLDTYVMKKEQHVEYLKLTKLKRDLEEKINGGSSKKEIQTLEQMKRSQELLECPHCHQHSKLHGNVLVACEHEGPRLASFGPGRDKEISQQQLLIKRLEVEEKQLLELSTKIRLAEDAGAKSFAEDPKLEGRIGTVPKTQAQRNLTSLIRVKIVAKPTVTIDEAKILLELYKLKKECVGLDKEAIQQTEALRPIDTITKERDAISREIKQKETDLASIIRKLDTVNKERNRASSERQAIESVAVALKNQIAAVQKKCSDLGAVTDDNDHLISSQIGETRELLRRTENLVVQSKRAQEIDKRKEKLQVIKSALKEQKFRLQSLLNLYENAIHQHHEQLQTVIDNINICIAHGIDKIFNYPINIALDLVSGEKEKIYKHKIGFTIIVEGKDRFSRNPDDFFSGGEMKRLILLIVIALNTLYSSPLLLLDEMFASLDTDIRESCLKLIKFYIRDRTVISAEHFAERGDYDHCIELVPTRNGPKVMV